MFIRHKLPVVCLCLPSVKFRIQSCLSLHNASCYSIFLGETLFSVAHIPTVAAYFHYHNAVNFSVFGSVKWMKLHMDSFCTRCSDHVSIWQDFNRSFSCIRNPKRDPKAKTDIVLNTTWKLHVGSHVGSNTLCWMWAKNNNNALGHTQSGLSCLRWVRFIMILNVPERDLVVWAGQEGRYDHRRLWSTRVGS